MTLKFIQDNILLIGMALASGAMLLWPLARRGAGGSQVNTLQATQMINKEDALVLDVREPVEYDKGHILNARNIPLGELDKRADELSRWKAKRVIVACATGARSGAALAVLKKHGFTNVVSLAGGVGAWQQAGLPIAKK
jgi:rhodanese-related sulfurtransferase